MPYAGPVPYHGEGACYQIQGLADPFRNRNSQEVCQEKRNFGVFFAGRGSALQADFVFAGDFAGRPLAQNFAGRGFERPAKKKGMSDEMLKELIAVVGMANETNRLVESYQVEVDSFLK